MDGLHETLADVAALIPRYSWEIMDEEQRDDLMEKVVLPRYMQTTSDGVQLGPTAWAEMVGASAAAVRNRISRLQASQKTIAPERSRALQKSAERHAKVVLREAPQGRIDEIVASLPPEAKKKVAEAVRKASPFVPISPRILQEREAAASEFVKPLSQMVSRFSAEGIALQIASAREHLAELVSGHNVTAEGLSRIHHEIEAFALELEVADGIVGLETI